MGHKPVCAKYNRENSSSQASNYFRGAKGAINYANTANSQGDIQGNVQSSAGNGLGDGNHDNLTTMQVCLCIMFLKKNKTIQLAEKGKNMEGTYVRNIRVNEKVYPSKYVNTNTCFPDVTMGRELFVMFVKEFCSKKGIQISDIILI